MCTIPPAPPPPPPPANFITISNSGTNSPSIPKSNVCQWASFNPQLWEACAKNNICLHEPPFQYKYTDFVSLIQVGPTCGLVALSMLLNGAVAPDEMLNITKREGFSRNGEMFSCNDMAKLTEKVIGLTENKNIKFSVKSGGLFSNEIIRELIHGAVLLVAYDADFNHAPCQRHGHTAHWALVCGIILLSNPGEDFTKDPRNIYVLCRHGKSKHLCAWLLESLDMSNKNLMEFSPKKKDDGLFYVLPEDGIGGENGLRDKFLIFNFL